MIEVEQYFEALADNAIRLLTADMRDETDAAGVMFVARVVQTLGQR